MDNERRILFTNVCNKIDTEDLKGFIKIAEHVYNKRKNWLIYNVNIGDRVKIYVRPNFKKRGRKVLIYGFVEHIKRTKIIVTISEVQHGYNIGHKWPSSIGELDFIDRKEDFNSIGSISIKEGFLELLKGL